MRYRLASTRTVLAAFVAAVAAAAAQGATPTLVSTWGNGVRDTVRCTPGPDVVNADLDDRVGDACETVLRRIAADGTTASGSQHATVAEPHALAVGRTVVTAYQVGRFVDGGASRIGVAVSTDGGRRWRSSLLPLAPGYERVSDPVVAWDPVRSTWLVALVAVTPDAGSALLVSRSSDTVSWDVPSVVASDEAFRFDKEWLACDAGPASPYRGRCYLAYNDVADETIAFRSSDDGGQTWGEPVSLTTEASGQVGAVPVVRPDGMLLVFWLRQARGQLVVRSTDGGATFSPPSQLAPARAGPLPGIRGVEIPSVAVGPDGTVTAVWHGCVSAPCTRNGIVASTSRDGVAWAPRRLIAPIPGAVAFLPTVAVSPDDGTVAVTFYALGSTGIDAYLVRSIGAGRWSTPTRLTARTIDPSWVARSRLDAMLGDYFGLVWVDRRPLAVLPLAGPPRGVTLRQPLFATLRVA